MHILFVHQNFPAQFGQIAQHLVQEHGFECTFVSERPPGNEGGVRRIQYHVTGGATRQTHYCSRTFENGVWHAMGVYEAMKACPEVQPDLIVGHSGFGSTLFLRDLYPCPVINYFEYFYRSVGSDMDFRPDFPCSGIDRLRARSRNAMILLDLENCDAGYAPTTWQRDTLPDIFRPKIRPIFDGIDTNVWRPQPGLPRRIGNLEVTDDTRIVTYVSRGMESMRGFDVFMKTAKIICDRRQDVVFAVVGEDRVCYGGDPKVTGTQSFKEWVLSQDDYDLKRFHFLGRIPPQELAQLLAISDLHIYLTVPFVLSWSLMNALACGTTVLASNTPPVREMIEHEKNGLLVDFFDVDEMANLAQTVLDSPQDFKYLGAAGVKMIQDHYSLDVCLPKMLELYDEVASASA